MTTTILVHNGHREVLVVTEDRFPHVVENEGGEDFTGEDWRTVNSVLLPVGQLLQTYCTETRRIVIVEPVDIA